MATDPTIGELFKQALVLDADVNAAVSAYMSDAETGVFPVGEGYGLDLGAAVDAHGPARTSLADPNASAPHNGGMARGPTRGARPTKPKPRRDPGRGPPAPRWRRPPAEPTTRKVARSPRPPSPTRTRT